MDSRNLDTGQAENLLSPNFTPLNGEDKWAIGMVTVALFAALFTLNRLLGNIPDKQRQKKSVLLTGITVNITSQILMLISICFSFYSDPETSTRTTPFINVLSSFMVNLNLLYSCLISCDLLYVFQVLDTRLSTRRIRNLRLGICIFFAITSFGPVLTSILIAFQADLSSEFGDMIFSASFYGLYFWYICVVIYQVGQLVYICVLIFQYNKSPNQNLVRWQFLKSMAVIAMLLLFDIGFIVTYVRGLDSNGPVKQALLAIFGSMIGH